MCPLKKLGLPRVDHDLPFTSVFRLSSCTYAYCTAVHYYICA